jgi:large subunit ribosomal protein L23
MEIKNTKTKNKKEDKKEVDKKTKTHPLIKKPRITEKTAISAEHLAYTFDVVSKANKNEIKKAIKMLYGVTPLKIAIIKIKEKKVTRHGITGIKQGGKKAVVYLKKGDKITFA